MILPLMLEESLKQGDSQMTQLHIDVESMQLPPQGKDFPLQFSLNFRMFMYFSGNHRVQGW